VDYLKILKAYINHVAECEGVDFITDGHFAESEIERLLTPDELEALKRASEESGAEYVKRNRPVTANQTDGNNG
jgi:MoaA/NifB/PqqE/SkfB family radical SAM enzyme